MMLGNATVTRRRVQELETSRSVRVRRCIGLDGNMPNGRRCREWSPGSEKRNDSEGDRASYNSRMVAGRGLSIALRGEVVIPGDVVVAEEEAGRREAGKLETRRGIGSDGVAGGWPIHPGSRMAT